MRLWNQNSEKSLDLNNKTESVLLGREECLSLTESKESYIWSSTSYFENSLCQF
jgi:hypothetical protein